MTLFFRMWMRMVFLAWLLVPVAGQGATSLQISEQDTKSGTKNILIQAEAIPLPQLLKEIETHSGIHFDVNDVLKEDLLTVDTQGEDWTSLTLGILKEYKQIHVWASPSHLKKVYLLPPLENPDLATSATGQKKGAHIVVPKNPASQNNPVWELSEKKLRKVASGKHRSPLPEELFDDPQIRGFLEKNGIKTRDDRNNLRLSMKVRTRARKALASIRRKKNAK